MGSWAFRTHVDSCMTGFLRVEYAAVRVKKFSDQKFGEKTMILVLAILVSQVSKTESCSLESHNLWKATESWINNDGSIKNMNIWHRWTWDIGFKILRPRWRPMAALSFLHPGLMMEVEKVCYSSHLNREYLLITIISLNKLNPSPF